jgi:hypothetical protein
MVAVLIVFNVSYDLLEITFNKSVLEGYDPNDNTRLFTEVNNNDPNLRFGFDQKFQELNPYTNLDDKEQLENNNVNEQDEEQTKEQTEEQNEKQDEQQVLNKSVNNNEINNNSVMQQEQSEIQKEKKIKNISALETSKSTNLASLVLSDEDINKKDKIKYNSEDKFIRNKDFIHGYSYMHTDNWSLPMKRQSVCKNPKPCKVCPRQTTGFDKDLMKWNISK